MSTNHNRVAHVQSVDRAISVLEALSRNGPSRVTEIAIQLRIHKSTAYRLLATLEDRGLVEQDESTEKYQLGFGLVSLANAVTADLNIVQRSRSICQSLSEETNETVTITVLEGDEPVVVHQAVSSMSALSADWMRRDTPIHCTAAGKIFLAHLSDRRLQRLLSRPLERYTENTIVDSEALEEQLQRVRTENFSFTIEELEVGLNAVGAPIFAIDGSVVAVISVSGPAFRIPANSIPELGAIVKRAALEISRRIGYHAETATSDVAT